MPVSHYTVICTVRKRKKHEILQRKALDRILFRGKGRNMVFKGRVNAILLLWLVFEK